MNHTDVAEVFKGKFKWLQFSCSHVLAFSFLLAFTAFGLASLKDSPFHLGLLGRGEGRNFRGSRPARTSEYGQYMLLGHILHFCLLWCSGKSPLSC